MAKKDMQPKEEKKKVEKYLTEIKELPPESEEIVEEKTTKELIVNSPKKPETKAVVNKSEEENDPTPADEDNTGFLSQLPISTKDLILGLVNIITLVLLVIVLLRFPTQARELRELRIEDLRNRSNVSFEFNDIEVNNKLAQELKDFFLDESGVVDFVSAVEGIRREGGSYKTVTFANQQAVKDKTGNFGLPVVIELEGSWEAIDTDLQAIDQLPYLVRPVRVEIEQSEAEEGVIVFKYGIFLYVSDEFGEN